ncbi:MAG: hypothetical protein HPY79_11460 [Bacteroidales bacterium]|nr:hypothetical protein [Bacteroidales bacterium]
MKKLVSIFSLFLVMAFIYSGCRKGEEDPWLSLRSRNQRLIGKWKLVEEKKIDIDEKNYYYNYLNKNTPKTFSTNYEYSKNEFLFANNEGNIATYSKSGWKSLLLLGDTLNIKDSILTLQENIQDYKIKQTGTYSFLIDIKKDHTYEATEECNYTKSVNVTDNSFGYEYTCSNGLNQTYNNSNNQNYQYDNKYTSTYSGTWKWDDKDKLFIDIGKMKGKIKRLSNNEIIIEYTNELNLDQYDYSDEIANNAVISECVIDYYNSMAVQQYVNKYFYLPNKKLYRHKTSTYVYQRWERIKD